MIAPIEIRAARKKRNLSLRDMQMLTGISAMHLSRIERGVNRLTDNVASRVFPVLGIGCTSINEPVVSALIRDPDLLALVKLLILAWKRNKVQLETLRGLLMDKLKVEQEELGLEYT